MIHKDSHLLLRRIPLTELRLACNKNEEDLDGHLRAFHEWLLQGNDLSPIHVVAEGPHMHRIEDGRKRFAAHILAGRETALCLVENRR
jgi:hypothetical protein